MSQHAYYWNWYFHHVHHCYEAYKLLEDEASQRLYLYLIAYRLTGHLSIKIPVDFDNGEDYKVYKDLEKFTVSNLEINGLFGPLKHFDFTFENKQYKIDCLGLEYYLYKKQYLFERGCVQVKPEKGDYVIDGGACLGDSALVFSNAVGEQGKVYAFDPVYEHIEILKYNVEQFPIKNIEIYECGLSDKNFITYPLRIGGYNPAFQEIEDVIPLCRLDSLLENGEICKLDYIKLDIEGSELEALQGSLETIKIFKPKLAVSIYHKPNDLFEIPLFIRKTFPFYKLYLNHYTIDFGETVLYCQSQP